jgi:perosamine synthetase
MSPIPVSQPDLTDLELKYASDAIQSSWISSTGPYVDRFETEFAALCGARASIAVANGTVALHLALLALGLGPGDEVIIPSLTYVATANSVRYTGAVPVFVDVDPQTWCIDPKLIEERITPRTKGIIAVHLYGHPADIDALSKIADQRSLWLVEDAAEAHFARYKGRSVGGLADVGMFSFYGNKIVTSGEGGALVINDEAVEKKARLLRGQGMDPERRYFFPVIGYNYRLTNVACAMLCAQLERRKQIVSRRREIFRAYSERLRELRGIGLQPIAPWADPAQWLYCITVEPEFGMDRDGLAKRLLHKGVDTRPFFMPIHELPPYQGSPTPGGLPVTGRLARTGLNLPTYSALTTTMIDEVCSMIASLRS